jgi:glycosyltransferase involved in cell wall biosynthesis
MTNRELKKDASFPLILTVDAINPKLNGIGRYTLEVAQRTPSLPDVEDVKYYCRGKFVGNLGDLQRGIKPKKDIWIKRKVSSIRSLFGRGIEHSVRKSIFHSTNYFLPKHVQNGIVTIHDLSVLKFPETHPTDRIKYFEKNIFDTLKRTAHIVTVSEYTRQEVVSYFGIPESMITPIHLGVDNQYRTQERLSASTHASIFPGLTLGGYTLSVATLEPRKNLDKLLSAYSLLPLALKLQYPLVLVGAIGWLADGLQSQIEELMPEGWLKVLGYVPESTLPQLYAGARLFVYPSMYEGFGLPVAEAMASGVPVITSDRSCLPEVGGGAAAIEAFSHTLQNGLEDDQWRIAAVSSGLVVSSKYTWDACIARTGDIYSKVFQRV